MATKKIISIKTAVSLSLWASLAATLPSVHAIETAKDVPAVPGDAVTAPIGAGVQSVPGRGLQETGLPASMVENAGLAAPDIAGSAAAAAQTPAEVSEAGESAGALSQAAAGSRLVGSAGSAQSVQAGSGREKAVSAGAQLKVAASADDASAVMDGSRERRGFFAAVRSFFGGAPAAPRRVLTLAERLAHSSAQKRLEALREASISDPNGAEHGDRVAAMAGGDPDAQVRIKAGETLFNMRGDAAVPTLIFAAQAPHAATSLATLETLLPMDSGRRALEAQVSEEMSAVSRGARGIERAPITTGVLTIYRQSAKDSSLRRQAELVLKSFTADPRGAAAIEGALNPGINYGKIALRAVLFPLLAIATVLVVGVGLLAVLALAEEGAAGLFDFVLIMWLLDGPSGKSKAEEWSEFEGDQEKALSKARRVLQKAFNKARAGA